MLTPPVVSNTICKLEGRALEVIVIICMFLPGCIRLAWFGDMQIGRGKRAGNRHVNGKAFVRTPDWNRDVARPPPVNITKETLLFHHGGQHALLANPV